MRQTNTIASYRRWLRSKLALLIEYEAEGTRYMPLEDVEADAQATLAEARERALELERPDLAKLCTGDPAIAVAACLAVIDSDGHLTADQVSAMFKVDIRTIRRRVADGTFPAPVRVGRSVRWKRADLERLW